MSISRFFWVRHPLILAYFLVLLTLVALLAQEWISDDPGFSLSHASVKDEWGMTSLSVYGENLHSDIRGVLTKNLVNEKALLWQQMGDVPLRLLDVKDGLALASFHRNKVVSIDLQAGGRPMLLDSVEMPGTVGQIEIVGDLALVGMTLDKGLALIDLKDPRELKVVMHNPLPGSVIGMAAERDNIYYTGLSMGVGRVDLSSKNPGTEALVSLDSPWKLSLQDKRMAVGTLKGKVNLFDISAQGRLVEVGVLDYPGQVVSGVAFTEEVLAVVLADGTLHLLNLSLWPQLHQYAQLQLPGQPLQLERVPGQASLAVGLAAGGMALVDVSQPTTPTLAGHLKIAKTFRDFVLNSESFLATSNSGLEMFALDEVANGEYAKLAPDAMIEQSYYELKSWNDHVYGYDKETLVELSGKTSTEIGSFRRHMAFVGKGGVRIFEQDEKGQPQNVGSLVLEEGARDARFRGDYLHVIHPEGLRIFSGARSEEMVVVSDLPLPGQLKYFEILDAGYLLVVRRDSGVWVVDVNDPEQPRQIASLVLPQHLQGIDIVKDVLVDGQRAYISYGAGGVHIVDMSSPAQPELLQIVDTPGYAREMALYDDLLLVADGKEGLFIIDVKDRNDALPVGSMLMPLRAKQVAVADDGLIVSSPRGGTMKLPLPQRLQKLPFASNREMRFDVAAVGKGQYVYLYDEKTSGKVALDVH